MTTHPGPRSLVGRVLDRVTRPPVLTAFALLQTGLIVLMAVGHLVARTDPAATDGDLGTGDFAAFHTGALMVREGRGDELYNFAAQRATQREHLGGDPSRWQPYLNPPALALLLAPATDLGYAWSFRLFSLASFGLLVGSLVAFLRTTPGVSATRLTAVTAFLLVLGYLPVALTAFGGQNTALTLAFLCGLYAALRLERPVVAGVLLGALSFKPQYVPLIGVALLLQRKFPTVLAAAIVGVIHYVAGAGVAGPAWPLDYLAALAEHGPREIAENGLWHFSLPAVARRTFSPGLATAVSAAGAIAVLAALIRAGRSSSGDRQPGPAFFGLLVAATMLLSPHLQYYEVGILALPVVLALDAMLWRGRMPSVPLRVALVAGYVAYPSWALSGTLGVQPFFLMLVLVSVWCFRLATAPGRPAHPPLTA